MGQYEGQYEQDSVEGGGRWTWRFFMCARRTMHARSFWGLHISRKTFFREGTHLGNSPNEEFAKEESSRVKNDAREEASCIVYALR